MSEYTPTVMEARAEYVANKSFRKPTGWRGAEEFDRMIAEVERAAAEKALTGAIDLIDAKAKAYADSANGLRAEKEWLDSNRYSNYAAGLDMAAGLLHRAAAAFRREEA